MIVLPERGFRRRMSVYLAEMFPLRSRVAVAVGLYWALASFLGFLHGTQVPVFSVHFAVGCCSFFLMILILRLMDELKDADVDRRLFSDRPLPSGRVRKNDIRISLVAAVLIFVAVNLLATGSFWSALAVLGYSFLMFEFFFVPRFMKRSLPLALATHSPFVPILLLHGVLIFADQTRIPLGAIDWPATLLVIALYWACFVGWELSRKIRAPEEEDDYQTYSRIFGGRAAASLTLGVQTLALGAALCFWAKIGLSVVFVGACLAGYALPVIGTLRFALRPSPSTANLRPYSEAFIAAFLVASVAEFGLLVPPALR